MAEQSRGAWILSAIVISFSWLFFFGLVCPSVPRGQWIDIAFGIMLVSGLLLLLINVLAQPRQIYGASYRFVMVWGASLPLAVTYLSSIALRDTVALAINIMLVVFVFVWANWTLTVLVKRKAYGAVALTGICLVAVGVSVLAGSWGWLTLGDWPMTPYLAYVLDQPIIYFGLLLFAVGLILWVHGTEQPAVVEVTGSLVWWIVDHLKGLVVLVLVIWLVVGVLLVYVVVRVPFRRDVIRTDATGLGVLHLIREVEEMDIGSMVGRTPDDGGFPPWFVDGGVLDHFSRKRWRFKINAPDNPRFREKGWMKYNARVEHFDGWVERNGTMVTARTSDGGFSVSRAPRTYWYEGGESTRIKGGFVVIMELSYKEIYGNVGAKGFSVGPQYAFFDGEERLVAILTPEKVGMIMA